jgi:hypothetical protein
MHEDSTKIWRTLVKLALLGTTGYMTWQALTRLMGVDAWLVSALGLVAFEGGLLLWPMYYQQADTNTQSGIAAVMAVIDLLGVAMAFGVEVMGNNPGMAGLIPQFADVATWGVIGVVIANVAAYIVVDAIDPDKQLARQMAAQSRAQKTAQLFIARQAAQATLSGIQETANQIVPGLAARNLADVRGHFGLVDGVNIEAPKAPPLQLADSGTSPTNGKRPSTPKSV